MNPPTAGWKIPFNEGVDPTASIFPVQKNQAAAAAATAAQPAAAASPYAQYQQQPQSPSRRACDAGNPLGASGVRSTDDSGGQVECAAAPRSVR